MSRGLAVFLAIMAGLFLLIANFSMWLGGSIFNREVFSQTTVTVMRTRPVREAVATVIINKGLKDFPELQEPVSSSFKSIVSDFLASKTARPALEGLANGVQKSFTSPNPTAVTLKLNTLVKGVQPSVDRINREFNVNISTTKLPGSIIVVNKGGMPSIYSWGAPFLWLGPLFGIFGIIMIAAAFGFGGADRWFVLGVNGAAIAISALAFLLLVRFASSPMTAIVQDDTTRVITQKIFDAFMGQLSARTWALAGIGAALAVLGFGIQRLAGKSPTELPADQQKAA